MSDVASAQLVPIMHEIRGVITDQNKQKLVGKLYIPKVIGTLVYEELRGKPAINGVELSGDKSFEELGEFTMTNSEIKDIIDTQFSTIFGGA